MAPLITALVDTYNHEKYIEQAIVSVLDQGLSADELEILVVDDGSTDRTSEIIQKFVPRVRHLRKRNGGQASAFNEGFAESRGEIIATLDGDDWWAKGKLSAVAGALEQYPEVSAVGHALYRFTEQEQTAVVCAPQSRSLLNLETPGAIRSWIYLIPSALTARRSVFEWIMPIPEQMVYMADSALQAAATVKGALILEEPLAYYRIHGENLYSSDAANVERLRRRYQMTEIAYGGVYERLLQLGVSEEPVAALLGGSLVEAKRANLANFGGTRRKAFQTETQAFRLAYKNPSWAYRLYKYLVVGSSTLILPPKSFYAIRNWYGKRRLGRYRNNLIREDVTAVRD